MVKIKANAYGHVGNRETKEVRKYRKGLADYWLHGAGFGKVHNYRYMHSCHVHKSKYDPHQGEREKARRRRQMGVI